MNRFINRCYKFVNFGSCRLKKALIGLNMVNGFTLSRINKVRGPMLNQRCGAPFLVVNSTLFDDLEYDIPPTCTGLPKHSSRVAMEGFTGFINTESYYRIITSKFLVKYFLPRNENMLRESILQCYQRDICIGKAVKSHLDMLKKYTSFMRNENFRSHRIIDIQEIDPNIEIEW